ncbi:hypothetical protein Len3610_04165 [Lentibacillus sp. CBA3610]|nr:hypothetical protein Len3610_04165 [Lentibacillus sp. CBA3610]
MLAAYRKSSSSTVKVKEKSYFRDFEKASGYACYPVVKKARSSEQTTINMK